jgi:hypothetical protein
MSLTHYSACYLFQKMAYYLWLFSLQGGPKVHRFPNPDEWWAWRPTLQAVSELATNRTSAVVSGVRPKSLRILDVRFGLSSDLVAM